MGPIRLGLKGKTLVAAKTGGTFAKAGVHKRGGETTRKDKTDGLVH